MFLLYRLYSWIIFRARFRVLILGLLSLQYADAKSFFSAIPTSLNIDLLTLT